MYSQRVRECQDLRSELNRLNLVTVPSNNISPSRSLAIAPSRSPATPSLLSRLSTTRSTMMTPPPVPSTQRAPLYPRSASTAPSLSGNRTFFVGSAPTSNTMTSALKYPPRKSHGINSRSVSPTLEEGHHQFWIPNIEGGDSNTGDKRVSTPSPQRASTSRIGVSSSGDRTKWPSPFHSPADVL
jgi:hypothetical protein